MPAAARTGDLSTHGGTITGPGAPTVFIGSMPASVAGDTHACAMPPPHLPVTPFLSGSATVLIAGRPAIRVGDTCLCGATAMLGEPTVLIG